MTEPMQSQLDSAENSQDTRGNSPLQPGAGGQQSRTEIFTSNQGPPGEESKSGGNPFQTVLAPPNQYQTMDSQAYQTLETNINMSIDVGAQSISERPVNAGLQRIQELQEAQRQKLLL